MGNLPISVVALFSIYEAIIIGILLTWIAKIQNHDIGRKPRMNINHCFLLAFTVPVVLFILLIVYRVETSIIKF